MITTTQINMSLESSFKALFSILHEGGDLTLSADETFEKYKEHILATNDSIETTSKSGGGGPKRAKKKSAIELWATDNKDTIKEWRDKNLKEDGKKPGYMSGRGEAWKLVTDEVRTEFTDKATALST